MNYFNPHLPQEATQSSPLIIDNKKYFNPHLPQEATPVREDIEFEIGTFQSTPPAGGDTVTTSHGDD